MSLYPVLWAVEHAPVYDAEERAILAALVIKGDFDGCNCWRSRPKLAEAARVDPKTVDRKLAAMERRGLIRRQPGPKPAAWLRLPADKRPVVWEALIPCEFWSAIQLEEINASRVERGRDEITPDNRPPIPDPPPKRARADKGKPNPNRSPKRGDSKSSRSDDSGGTTSPVAGGLQVQSRLDSKSTNLLRRPSEITPTPLPPGDDDAPSSTAEAEGGGDEIKNGPDSHADGLVAEILTVRPDWTRKAVLDVLTRPEVAERPAEVVRLAFLAVARDRDTVAPGRLSAGGPWWAEAADRVGVAARPQLPPRCDDPQHDPQVVADRNLYDPADDGPGRPCPRCHPRAIDAA